MVSGIPLILSFLVAFLVFIAGTLRGGIIVGVVAGFFSLCLAVVFFSVGEGYYIHYYVAAH